MFKRIRIEGEEFVVQDLTWLSPDLKIVDREFIELDVYEDECPDLSCLVPEDER